MVQRQQYGGNLILAGPIYLISVEFGKIGVGNSGGLADVVEVQPAFLDDFLQCRWKLSHAAVSKRLIN